MSRRWNDEQGVELFWGVVERASLLRQELWAEYLETELCGASEWVLALARAALLELSFRLAEAEAALQSSSRQPPGRAWERARTIVEQRLAVRRAGPALPGLLDSLERLAAGIPAELPETAARAWHLFGVACLRTERMSDAGRALLHALGLMEPGLGRVWVLDGVGQMFIGQGAWHEARRTLQGVADLKRQLGDRLGLAITAGNLGLLDLELGNPEAAEQAVLEGLEACRDEDARSRMRLRTLLVQARLDSGRVEEGAATAADLREDLARLSDERHYLKGHACVALARAAGRLGGEEARDETCRWLDRAAPEFGLDAQHELLRYWRARLLGEQLDTLDSPPDAQARGMIAQGTFLSLLYVARLASEDGDEESATRHLDSALELATRSNNRLWMQQVDDVFGQLAPEAFARRVVERFSGRSMEEVGRTTTEEATIVFADLVGFSKRSEALPPDEIMATVRSLFELAVPVMTRCQVRPVQHLGDGLLAACQGPDHQRRGLEFALELVRTAGQASAVREALGAKWRLDLRAGVASGPVVFGLLGSQYKQEYLAIGRATNLAARLQGQAEPGEVMCAGDTAELSGQANGAPNELELKGIGKVAAVRYVAAEAEIPT